MRSIGRSLVALAAAFMVAGLVGGQQPGGFGGRGAGTQDAYTLLRNEQVKKELGITDEQVEKVPAAVLKALSGILDEKQLMRLRQIELQQRGACAFLDPTVQKQLSITPEQSGNIKTILDDSQKEMAEAFKEAKGGNFQGVQEKIASLRKETNDKVTSVLNAEQQKTYKQMVGETFKLEQRGFGGGGGRGKKKKDVE